MVIPNRRSASQSLSITGLANGLPEAVLGITTPDSGTVPAYSSVLFRAVRWMVEPGREGSKYGIDEYPEIKYLCMAAL
jgi:hypothetical protein